MAKFYMPTIFALGLAVLTSCTPSEKPARVNCSGNLKQLGLALQVYAGDYDGNCPDELWRLIELRILLAGRAYLCYDHTDTKPAKNLAEFRTGKHCDYEYAGKGKQMAESSAKVVIAYDKATNHPNGWINVLYADGNVSGAIRHPDVSSP